MNIKYNNQQFVEKAKKVHGELLYDYNLIEYKNNRTKVKILCDKCKNYFFQRPYDHLKGHGCTLCLTNKRKTTKNFIIKAKTIYQNNEYDYSCSIYKSSKKKIKIKCNKCNLYFMQIAKDHFRFGCKNCCSNTISKLEKNWLNSLNILIENRQKTIIINNKKFIVDGYDPNTNTVYEFLGDFWHGNLEKFKPQDINPFNKKSFEELYREFLSRMTVFKENHYNVVYVWESDYKRINK